MREGRELGMSDTTGPARSTVGGVDELIQAMKAAGEPTRLRILAVLQRNELTVNELCGVLGQSQPRVSRHLKLLCEAGLLVRHAEGTSAFYRPAPTGLGRELFRSIRHLIDESDPVLDRDLDRLAGVRAERAANAAAYFESIAADWDDLRELHVADTVVEQAMVDAASSAPIGRLLDIGTGTARVLEVFADRIDDGVGIDLSREMLNLARTRLDQKGLTHCTVRHGNVYDLDIMDASIDVAVLHHVLHFLDDPAEVIRRASRTLRPGGRLLVVDFGPHEVESLRSDFAHRRLGFSDDEMRGWSEDAGLDVTNITHFSPERDDESGLTVTLWVATRHLAPTPIRSTSTRVSAAQTRSNSTIKAAS